MFARACLRLLILAALTSFLHVFAHTRCDDFLLVYVCPHLRSCWDHYKTECCICYVRSVRSVGAARSVYLRKDGSETMLAPF